MGQSLYEASPAARAVFDQADELLGFPLSDLCFHGPEEALTDTANQQPALLTTSLATLAAMRAQGWAEPEYAAGHSLGEFSALVAAGALPFPDGLALVRRRGELMKAAGERAPGGMAAILGLEAAAVQALCAQAASESGRPLQIANDNCPGQLVISGDREALEQAMALAEAAGARKVVRLPVSIAAHSELMRPAAEEFAGAVDEAPLARPRFPVVGNVSASPLETAEQIRAELKAQLTSAVRWTESMQALVAAGVDAVVEVGPGDVLLGLMKRIDRDAARLRFEL
jgi:[acyl-carrier-protein] S-malonyltransferase